MHSNRVLAPQSSIVSTRRAELQSVGSISEQFQSSGVIPVNFFDEHDVAPSYQSAPSGSQIGRAISDARSAEERIRIVSSILQIIGFSSLGCLIFRFGREQLTRIYALANYSSLHFGRKYFESRQYEIDPRVLATLGSSLPFVWNLQSITKSSRCNVMFPRTRTLLAELDSCELRSGLALGIKIDQDLHGFLCFGSPNSRHESLNDNVVGQAIALGLAVHQSAAQYVRRIEDSSSAEGRSQIQTDILRYVARGMSDKQIAAKLNTSTYNVDYHLRILREKHGVSNRAQLAFKAASLVLI